MTTSITTFQGPHRWLSNFWPVPVSFEGEVYPSVEHAYVAAKTKDLVVRSHIRSLVNPGAAKRYGRSQLVVRHDWDDIKLEVMEHLLREKFKDKRLRALLVETGSAHIQEGNTWGDTFWGTDMRGNGHNYLGKLIMKIRAEIAHG